MGYKVGEIIVLRSMKKKQGFFLCEVDVGDEENISIVTAYSNAQVGMKVIVAPVGSTVNDEEVLEEFKHGERSEGVICGNKEMDWSGAFKCIVLDDECEVGSSAPANSRSPLIKADGAPAESDVEDEDVSKKRKEVCCFESKKNQIKKEESGDEDVAQAKKGKERSVKQIKAQK